MAYKVFATEEVLASADVNTYLMRQGVIVCTSGTRPSSPNEGMTIYETDTDTYRTWDGSLWAILLTQHRQVIKPSDTARSSGSGTGGMSADPHLTIALPINSTWALEGFIIYSGSAGSSTEGDLIFGWTGPASATLDWFSDAIDIGLGAGDPAVGSVGRARQDISSTPTGGTRNSGLSTAVVANPRGRLKIAGTAGSITFRWGRFQASGTTTVHADSYLRVSRMS